MPYGLRRIKSTRTMLTKSLTALVSFNTQEVFVPGGIYYGVNAVSGNLIIGLRTKLINGNAMVVATSGGGKSMFVKQEILEAVSAVSPRLFLYCRPGKRVCALGSGAGRRGGQHLHGQQHPFQSP